ncbi:hypothetical protein SCUP515_08616 [Seiridium cupressi]
MYNPMNLDTLDAVKTCLAPCFGPRAEKAPETSSYDEKHANKVRERLRKRTIASGGTAPTPRTAFEQSAPFSASQPERPQGFTVPLTLVELGELFDTLDETLSGPGIPYAVCGLAALISHGVTDRGANTVSILVPADSRMVIRPWALTSGNTVMQNGSTGGFEIQTKSGIKRGIKIRWVDGACFEKLFTVKSQIGTRGAMLLGLASCLDQVATAFMRLCKNGQPPAASKEVDTIMQDIYGILGCVIERSMVLEKPYLDLFLSPSFWRPFESYLGDRMQEIMVLCTKAKLPIAEVLEIAKRHSDIRQHDRLLGQYGMPPMLVVEEQPGAFQKMRTLGRVQPSMYTLKSKDSNSDISGPTVGRSLTRPLPGPSRLKTESRVSLDDGVRRADMAPRPPTRSNSYRPPYDGHKLRASMDLVSGVAERPEGWL